MHDAIAVVLEALPIRRAASIIGKGSVEEQSVYIGYLVNKPRMFKRKVSAVCDKGAEVGGTCEMNAQPKARKKKPSARIEKAKAWKVFSRYIRERDKWTCYTCGKSGEHDEDRASHFDAGHLISRYWAATLFDEDNVHCQCKGCNILHEQDSEIYKRKWISEYGADAFEQLYAKSKTSARLRASDYIAIRKNYESKLTALLEGKT